MGKTHTPGQFDCLERLLQNPDMPRFILLPTDKLAPKTIRDWAVRQCQSAQGVEDQAEHQRMIAKGAEAYQVAGDMEAWLIERQNKPQDPNLFYDEFRMMPLLEDIADAWRWLMDKWGGGVICGAGLCLAVYALRMSFQ